jgi:hypothetical protein
MRVEGLGYIAEYFRLDDHEIVHAAVPYVDPQVRAYAPVWLPHIAPAPLCGLGVGASGRVRAHRSAGILCRGCAGHLRELDEWVRIAEHHLQTSDGATNGYPVPAATARAVHGMPF